MRLIWKLENHAVFKCYYGNQHYTDWFIRVNQRGIGVWNDHNLYRLVIKFDNLLVSDIARTNRCKTCILTMNIHLSGLLL